MLVLTEEGMRPNSLELHQLAVFVLILGESINKGQQHIKKPVRTLFSHVFNEKKATPIKPVNLVLGTWGKVPSEVKLWGVN